jgi:hypothetical protein
MGKAVIRLIIALAGAYEIVKIEQRSFVLEKMIALWL